MDPEDIEDVTLNSTFVRHEEIAYRRPSDFVLIPACLLCICAIIANAMIIFIIIKFKNLHTILYNFILQWSLCNALFLMLSPVNFTVLARLEYIAVEIACIWFGQILVLFVSNVMFVFALIIDWCIMNYFSQLCFKRYRRFHIFEITTIWILAFALTIYNAITCEFFRKITIKSYVAISISYAIFVTFMIFRCVKQQLAGFSVEKFNMVIIITSSFFIFWFPNYVIYTAKYYETVKVPSAFTIFCSAIGESNAIVVLIVLYIVDKNFHENVNSLCKIQSGIADETEDNPSNFEVVDLKATNESALI